MTSNQLDTNHRFQWVLIADLEMTCPQWGRPLRPGDVRSIAAALDPDKLGVIAVWYRPDLHLGHGRYVVIDGQHRLAAMRLVGWDDQRAPCLLYEGLTMETAAELSLGLQERRNLHPLDRHRAAATAHDRGAVEIDKVLAFLGLRLCYSVQADQRRATAAIGTIGKIWERMDSVGLERVLWICREAWDGTAAGLGAKIMKLAAYLLAAHDGDIDDQRMAEVLAKRSPAQWVATNVTPPRPLSSIAQDVILEYNKVRGGMKLPELTPHDYENAARRPMSSTVRGPIPATKMTAGTMSTARSRKRGVKRS